MPKQIRISLFALITLLTLLANLMFPTSVLADDETPPPVATEETTPPEESEAETPPQEPTGEPAPVSETLEKLPENTEIIVLDENGEPLPLVTEEAEEAIIIGDPVWCPSSLSAPTPGANGCTTSYISFQDLITYLDANEQAMDGTIWIESTYNSSVNDAASSGFVFNGGSFTTMSNYALTIQGGWNGVSGSSSIGSASIFSGDYLTITNWGGDVTINDIAMDGTSGSHGITVVTNGSVNLSDTSVQNSDLSGVYIDNRGGTEDVTIAGTNNFSDNDHMGLLVYSRGDISVSGTIANNNTLQSGALLDNTSGSGNVSVSNSTFNGNGIDANDYGLAILSAGNVTLNNITASNNYYYGAVIDNNLGTGNVTLTGNNVFNNNDLGLLIFSAGEVNISNLTADNNDLVGSIIDNSSGTGNVSITNGQFSNNYSGLAVTSAGNITLNNVIANGNDYVGAELFNCGCVGTVGINVFGSTFNNNGNTGLLFDTNGAVIIENTTANNNGVGGIGGDALGDITVINTSAIGNQHGLGFSTPGDVNIKCSIVTNNSIDGVYVGANNLNLIGSTITNNGVDYVNIFGAVNIFDYNCTTSSGGGSKKPVSGSGLPLNIVQGGSSDLDCDKYSGTVLILPNGDKVTFKCPIGDSASLNAVANDGLPNALPDGVEYVSGLVAVPSPDGSDTALDGLVVVSFVIPEDMQGEDFAILYWDGTEWVDLDSAAFDDGRTVLNGGYVTEDGYFEAFTNFSGNFVLVKK